MKYWMMATTQAAVVRKEIFFPAGVLITGRSKPSPPYMIFSYLEKPTTTTHKQVNSYASSTLGGNYYPAATGKKFSTGPLS